MKNLKNKLQDKLINFEKLLDYGFIKKDGTYYYKKSILDDCFVVIIEISQEKQISKVIDLAFNDEYTLIDVDNPIGSFVGKVKNEYEKIITDFINCCTLMDVFKSKQTQQVIDYVRKKYNGELEYLWKKDPHAAIWRNKDNQKWYGLVMTLEENKLFGESKELVEIIDLRYQKNEVDKVVDNKTIFKGYHMNKNSWITLKLDESLDIKKIYELIDNSFELVK